MWSRLEKDPAKGQGGIVVKILNSPRELQSVHILVKYIYIQASARKEHRELVVLQAPLPTLPVSPS